MNTARRHILLIFAVIVIVSMIGYLEVKKPRQLDFDVQTIAITPAPPSPAPAKNATSSSIMVSEDRSALLKEKKAMYSPAKELSGIKGYINSSAFKLADLVGKKIILIDFWTYSCINCQRTTPYLNAWYEKYKERGFVIVGVHTPEFEFEKNYNNVAKALKNAGIMYPVVLDNDYGTWNAYSNRYWPHEYLIDIDGYIVYDHIGEGSYDKTEQAIQSALAERQIVLHLKDSIDMSIVSPARMIPMDSSLVASPEIYFGSARNQYLGNGIVGVAGSQTLSLPSQMKSNMLYLEGMWNFGDEFAQTISDSVRIVFTYNAKNVYIVASSLQGVVIKVTRDGKLLGSEAGKDVAQDGTISIKDERLYDLIHGLNYGEHKIEIEIKGAGLRVFTFTFG